VHLIHGVDSFKLLQEINKQAEKIDRNIDCLLQIHIAQEETKFGLNEEELAQTIHEFEISKMKNVNVSGLMGMASFSDNANRVRSEFKNLKKFFDKYAESQTKSCKLQILSMGMSGDYKIAVEEGSTMVRIGSLLFGERK
jgi:pyridoxal phosphate enzyme (YggS family)